MTMKKIERLLLLEQSGELTNKQRQKLQRELSSLPAARELRDELNRLNGAVFADAEPAAWSTAKIISRLKNETPAGLKIMLWKPAFAVVCLAAVMVLTFRETETSPASVAYASATETDWWSDPLDEKITQLENLIAAISSDPVSIIEF